MDAWLYFRNFVIAHGFEGVAREVAKCYMGNERQWANTLWLSGWRTVWLKIKYLPFFERKLIF